MPMYVFSCKNQHVIEKIKLKPYKREVRYRCEKCGLWMYKDFQRTYLKKPTKDRKLDYERDPISHLVKQDGFKGIRIEALTPKPVFVKTREQYSKLLQSTNSKEIGR